MRKERGSDSDSKSSSKGNDFIVKELKFSAFFFFVFLFYFNIKQIFFMKTHPKMC